jgi:ABC-2 type transport system permease protein
MLAMIGNPDTGAIFAGYLGSLLLGAFYLAIGIFISGLFKDQIAAFIVGLIVCFFFFFAGTQVVVGVVDGWFSGVGSFVERYVGLSSHFEDIQRGVIDLHNVLYFVSMSVLFLVLNTLSLEGRRY